MKKYYKIAVVLLLFGVFLSSCAEAAQVGALPTIGVYKISSDRPHISELLTDSMSSVLAKMKSCNVVERAKLSQVFSEQALTYDGIVSAVNQGSGQAIGLDYLLIGSSNSTVAKKYNKKYNYTYYDTKITLNLKLIDVHGQIGKVVWSGQRSLDSINRTGDISDIAAEVVYDLGRQLYEQKFPITGYVIKGEKGQFYVDLGTEDGVDVKDKFVVKSTGDVIVHPVTGEIITEGSVTGTLKVIEVHENYSIAVPDGDLNGAINVKDEVVKKIKSKPKDWTGLLWSGKVVF